MAVLDQQNLPGAAAGRFLDGQEKPIDIRLSKSALRDLEKAAGFEFLQIRADATLPRPHIFGQLRLPREAGVVSPGVFQKHGVGELGSDGQLFLGEDEVRHLREAMKGDGISPISMLRAMSAIRCAMCSIVRIIQCAPLGSGGCAQLPCRSVKPMHCRTSMDTGLANRGAARAYAASHRSKDSFPCCAR